MPATHIYGDVFVLRPGTDVGAIPRPGRRLAVWKVDFDRCANRYRAS